MKLLDIQISEDMLTIVNEEVTRILRAGAERNAQDMLMLEKAAKIYSLLQANSREMIKAGSFGNMTDEDLKNAEGLESTPDRSGSDDEL